MVISGFGKTEVCYTVIGRTRLGHTAGAERQEYTRNESGLDSSGHLLGNRDHDMLGSI